MRGDTAPVAGSKRFPQTIGRYRIDARLASDATDDVFKGFDPLIERPVVVKAFRIDQLDAATSAAIKDTFYNEMRHTGALVHSSILTLFDAGESPGMLFMATEYVEGENLADLLADDDTLDPVARAQVFSDLVEALEYARESAVAHLNLKPSNVVVTPDRHAKVGGFGVAVVVDAIALATNTPPSASPYVAPERTRREAADHHADVYSVAQIAVDLFKGLRPESGPAAERWSAVLTRALSPNPLDRLDSVTAFKRELFALLGIQDSGSRIAWETSASLGRKVRRPEPEGDTAIAPAAADRRPLEETVAPTEELSTDSSEAGTMLVPGLSGSREDTHTMDEAAAAQWARDHTPDKSSKP